MGVDPRLGVVDGGDDQVLEHLDVGGIGERRVDLDAAQLALAIERRGDQPTAGRARESRTPRDWPASRPSSTASPGPASSGERYSSCRLLFVWIAQRRRARPDVGNLGVREGIEHRLDQWVLRASTIAAARALAACSPSVGAPSSFDTTATQRAPVQLVRFSPSAFASFGGASGVGWNSMRPGLENAPAECRCANGRRAASRRAPRRAR